MAKSRTSPKAVTRPRRRALEPELVGRTYDDFLFRPRFGKVATRRDLSLVSPLSRHLRLALPLVSANMDSVTGEHMARVMALEGGLGFVHRGMGIEAQRDQVRRVKRSQGYVVEEPFCLPRDATLREARAVARKHNVTGLLVEETRGSRILAGLLSHRDMPWVDGQEERRVEEYMTPRARLVVGRPGIPVGEAERLMFARRVEKLPLVEAGGRIRGLVTKRDILLFRERPFTSKDGKGRLLVGAAIGARGDYLERAAELLAAGADLLLVDIAHGHSQVMKIAVEAIRKRFGPVELAGGNVGTGEGARFLRDLGVDAIKVGIGPGRGCRTRLETAAGVPQLQAIRECWLAVGDEVPLIADGGIKDDKDVFLALVVGASSVMLGSALSGTDEAPGHVIEDPGTGQKRKIYRGMTSPQAVFGALYDADDPADVAEALQTPAEGQEIQIPYRGSVVHILRRLRGHLCSAISYGGGGSLAEVRSRVVVDPLQSLIPISEAGRRESYER